MEIINGGATHERKSSRSTDSAASRGVSANKVRIYITNAESNFIASVAVQCLRGVLLFFPAYEFDESFLKNYGMSSATTPTTST